MTLRAFRWVLAIGGVGVVAVIACSGGSGPGPGGKGLCTTSCPKTCDKDSDCPSGSQLCCDFGGKGKACTAPQDCYPARFCTDDSKCNTQSGETCCAANPAQLDQKVCVPAAACKKTCATDNDCAGGNTPKCCTLYAKPICTTAESCPSACSQSSECNTANNETCCNGVKAIYKDVIAGNVNGICLRQGIGCPKACAASTDCDTTKGELCCDTGNGKFCSTSCQKACDNSSDCDTSKNQLCCNVGALGSPWYGFRPTTPPPPCGGTGRCTRQSDCSNGQVCCGTVVGGTSTCGQTCVSTCRSATACMGATNMVCP